MSTVLTRNRLTGWKRSMFINMRRNSEQPLRGEKNNGFDVLYHNMKYGLIASKELAEFLRERSNIEENTSKLLIKLAKQTGGVCLQGTFAPMWGMLRSSAEKLSNIHLQMVHKVTELVKEVSKYADELHKKHKMVKEEESGTLEVVQAIQTTFVTLQKAKDAYTQKGLEFDKLKKENASSKDLEKAETKLKKAQEDYKNLVDKYSTIKEDFEKKMSQACKEQLINWKTLNGKDWLAKEDNVPHFQDVEEAHLNQMREFLNTYAEVLQSNHDLIGQVLLVHIEFKRQCLEMTVDKLLEQFVLNKYTGLEKPEFTGVSRLAWKKSREGYLRRKDGERKEITQGLGWSGVGVVGGLGVEVGALEGGPLGGVLFGCRRPLHGLLSVGLAGAAGVAHPGRLPVKRTSSGELVTDGTENMNCGAVQAVERVVGEVCASAEERYKGRLNSSVQFEELILTGMSMSGQPSSDSSERPTNGEKLSKKEGNLDCGGQKPKESKTSRRTTSLLNLFMSNSQGTLATLFQPEQLHSRNEGTMDQPVQSQHATKYILEFGGFFYGKGARSMWCGVVCVEEIYGEVGNGSCLKEGQGVSEDDDEAEAEPVLNFHRESCQESLALSKDNTTRATNFLNYSPNFRISINPIQYPCYSVLNKLVGNGIAKERGFELEEDSRATHPLYCLDRSTVHVFEAVRDECTSIHSAKENSCLYWLVRWALSLQFARTNGKPLFLPLDKARQQWRVFNTVIPWSQGQSTSSQSASDPSASQTRAICLTLSPSPPSPYLPPRLTLPGLPLVPPRLTLPEHPSVPPRLTLPEHPSVPPRLTLPEHPSVPPRLTLPEHPSVPQRLTLPKHPSVPQRLTLPEHPYVPPRLTLPEHNRRPFSYPRGSDHDVSAVIINYIYQLPSKKQRMQWEPRGRKPPHISPNQPNRQARDRSPIQWSRFLAYTEPLARIKVRLLTFVGLTPVCGSPSLTEGGANSSRQWKLAKAVGGGGGSSCPVMTRRFLRSRRDKRKEKKSKKKKDGSDSMSNKEDKSDVDDKEERGKSDTPTPEVDEEGYCIRPKVESWENDKASFYSSSDTDSDDERERKIHVEIKPLSNGSAPISASVDELRATVENISLSSVIMASGRRSSTADSDHHMKRSQSVSQQLGSGKPSSDLLGLNLYQSPTASSASTPTGSHPYAPLQSPSQPIVNSPAPSSTSRYAALVGFTSFLHTCTDCVNNPLYSQCRSTLYSALMRTFLPILLAHAAATFSPPYVRQ
uniref:F-BAR domain-containing protein n=1 Tax=Timema tahoe TaxID=61484 RepID=A0A7R9FGH2_9NEOP|nr:unnamed protein product [Timema tahoe]